MPGLLSGALRKARAELDFQGYVVRARPVASPFESLPVKSHQPGLFVMLAISADTLIMQLANELFQLPGSRVLNGYRHTL
jgi:hypothetical protein